MISAALLNTVITAACKFSHSGNVSEAYPLCAFGKGNIRPGLDCCWRMMLGKETLVHVMGTARYDVLLADLIFLPLRACRYP